MVWRAPEIKPKTAIISDNSIFKFTNGYALSAAISLLYPPVITDDKMPYWFIDAYDTAATRGGNLSEFLNGTEIGFTRRSFVFSGSSRDTLMIDYKPQEHCLWILNPNDVDNVSVPSILRDLLPAANLSRIEINSASPGYPPVDVFGNELPHDWCYYFQKADLARQQKDWQRMLILWDEAHENGFHPTNAFELIPFIEAFGYTGNWNKAGELSRESSKWQLNAQAMLCSIWKRFRSDQTIDARGRDEVYLKINERLKCP
jgi:hypothetical protein